MAITISGSGITSANIADGTIVNADVADVAASKLTGALPAIDGSALTGMSAGGITEADAWRLTTSFTGDAAHISSNWERVDTDAFGKLGTGMSESSGVFSFPSTGYWEVFSVVAFSLNSDDRWCAGNLEVTTNNSSWNRVGQGIGSIKQAQSSNTAAAGTQSAIFDVTDIANIKVRISVDVNNTSTQTRGDSNENRTFLTFKKLGDT